MNPPQAPSPHAHPPVPLLRKALMVLEAGEPLSPALAEELTRSISDCVKHSVATARTMARDVERSAQDARARRIYEDLTAGQPLDDVARKHGLAPSTTWHEAQQLGLTKAKLETLLTGKAPLDHEARNAGILTAYLQGERVETLRMQHKLSRARLFDILKRTATRRRRGEERRRVWEETKAKHAANAIAAAPFAFGKLHLSHWRNGKMATDALGQQTMTEADWRAEGRRRFGPDMNLWRFRCPACGHAQTPADYRAAKAPEGTIAFSCIGRFLPECSPAFSGEPGPCNYAGGGLFKMNPVKILAEEGHETHYFAFADP